MAPSSFDPADTTTVRDKFARYLRDKFSPSLTVEEPARFASGLDTYVYAFTVNGGGIPPEWSGQLVLRVYPSMEQCAKAEREYAIQHFVTGLGFPAPIPLLVDGSGDPFGLPFMIMQRVPGSSAMDRFKNPLAIASTVSRMAALQARLHQLPTEGCPLPYESPLVDRWLERSTMLIAQYHPPGLDAPRRWLKDHASLVREEEPVLTHNDFHPMNLIVDGERMTLLDWPDAALGDRHCDVARTLALFWLASAFERSLLGRTALRALRGPIVRRYERAYSSHLPLDNARIRYWQALHAFNAWVQIATMRQEGEAAVGARAGVLDELPTGLTEALKQYFSERAV